jgi:type IX secretion system PorP/SprF family membrane protein
MFNMVNINPAYAGNRVSDNFTAIYRDQWIGLTGAPKTADFSWDKRRYESNVGYGLQIYDDQLGLEKNTGFQAFYSYHIPLGDSFLALGLSGGVMNYQVNYAQAATFDPTDPLFQSNVNGWLATAGFGVLYATPTWYVSFSIPQMLHTSLSIQNYENQADIQTANQYFLTGGYVFDLSESVKAKPSLMVRAEQGSPVQYDLNLNFWFSDIFSVGASYRQGDALIGMLEFQVLPQLRIGYAYDHSISTLGNYNQGSHEIMLRLELPNNSCPWCDKQKETEPLSPRYY